MKPKIQEVQHTMSGYLTWNITAVQSFFATMDLLDNGRSTIMKKGKIIQI